MSWIVHTSKSHSSTRSMHSNTIRCLQRGKFSIWDLYSLEVTGRMTFIHLLPSSWKASLGTSVAGQNRPLSSVRICWSYRRQSTSSGARPVGPSVTPSGGSMMSNGSWSVLLHSRWYSCLTVCSVVCRRLYVSMCCRSSSSFRWMCSISSCFRCSRFWICVFSFSTLSLSGRSCASGLPILRSRTDCRACVIISWTMAIPSPSRLVAEACVRGLAPVALRGPELPLVLGRVAPSSV
mmetsp:Transcript_31269/g.56153  ORF Transcript_31269/g.56153 Transcript_31269/m.56153 type:complete len:236 (+) Transcript_31269:308-1015(+)